MTEQEKTPVRVGKVVQQATVLFAGAQITAVLEDAYVYGALPHLCRALDLDGDGQRERIEEQPGAVSQSCRVAAKADQDL